MQNLAVLQVCSSDDSAKEKIKNKSFIDYTSVAILFICSLFSFMSFLMQCQCYINFVATGFRHFI